MTVPDPGRARPSGVLVVKIPFKVDAADRQIFRDFGENA